MFSADHIASFGVLFPIQRLVDVCKSRGVMTLIDGAHAPGQVTINLEQLGTDFYVGKLPVWFSLDLAIFVLLQMIRMW